MQLKKNIKVGNKLNLFLFIYLFSIIITSKTSAEINLDGNKTDIKILDKISSKNELIKLVNNEEYIYKDLAIKSIKCTDSKFDDNPEVKACLLYTSPSPRDH